MQQPSETGHPTPINNLEGILNGMRQKLEDERIECTYKMSIIRKTVVDKGTKRR